MLVFVQRFVWILLLLFASPYAAAIDSNPTNVDVEVCHHQEHCQIKLAGCIAHCASMSCCAAVFPAVQTIIVGSVAPFVDVPVLAKVLPNYVEIILPPPKQAIALI